ncbi:WYL domain-containing protein [Psychrobacter sp.]|uniref:WYL domain-containing protein n=1 Tax=Psychrobacter sp. TaxID=56811 RepID=UPI003F9D7D90
MGSRKHERLAYRLSDIIIRLNNGERLNIESLAQDYQVCIRTLKRDFQERLATLDFSDSGPVFYRLSPSRVGYLNLTEIRRFANFDYENIQARTQEFTLINQAIKDCRIISFDYQKVRQQNSQNARKHYYLEPYHLLNKNGIWYVIGRRDAQTRNFCFTQMSNLCVTDKTYDCDEEIKADLINTDSLFFDNHITEIVLQVRAKVAGYFERRDLLPNQELIRKLDNGDLLLACRHVHPREVTPIVQYWLPHIRIISPSNVQEEMEEILKSYLSV